MALHERETVRDQMDDCVFADRDLTRPVAKYRFPAEGTLPRDAFQLVSDELMTNRVTVVQRHVSIPFD